MFGRKGQCLFAKNDLRAAFPGVSESAYTSLLNRAVKYEVLENVCRGIYVAPHAACYRPGLVLYHAAARLRAGRTTYLSLESVLSEAGIISQMLLDRATVVTTGRKGEVKCGKYGVIEFTHTSRAGVSPDLWYDEERRLWVASPAIAWRDLQRVGRNTDMVDQELLQEAIAA